MSAALDTAGGLLRRWRQQRGVSQLALSLEADVSTRHISFVETGRSTPSREMIVQLSEALEIPLRERNRILQAAGFAALYRQTELTATNMDHVRRAIDLILRSQHPAGAVAVDWSWNVVDANRSMMATIAHFAEPALLAEAPLNVMKLVFAEDGLHRHIVNWDEVGPVMAARIRREADHEGRPETRALLDELLDSPAVSIDSVRAASQSPPPLLIPMHLAKQGVELRLFSTITTLGTPQDITLQELRIESFHPMDEASLSTLRELCGE